MQKEIVVPEELQQKLPKKRCEVLVTCAHGKLGVTRRYNIDKKYVSNIFQKYNVTHRQRNSAPKYSEKQKIEQKKEVTVSQ